MIIPRKANSGPPLRVLYGSSIFTTELYADDWCDETLSQRPFEPWWSYPIELTDDKLSRVNPSLSVEFPVLGDQSAECRRLRWARRHFHRVL